MGKIEIKTKKARKRHDIQQLVLGTIAAAGILSVTLVAPNTISAMKRLGLAPSPRQKESIANARKRLIQKGLLQRDARGFLQLTKKGERTLLRLQILKHGLSKPKRWDGKWRVLIFDIPNKRKGLRAKLRQSLQTVGFVLLQNSVWIYPYDCEDFIALLKTDFRIGKDMRYLIVEALEGDTSYRRLFGLKK